MLYATKVEIGMTQRQAAVAWRLECVDWWRKVLNVIALLCSLAISAGYLYQNWISRLEGPFSLEGVVEV
jgi:hypothetical protein